MKRGKKINKKDLFKKFNRVYALNGAYTYVDETFNFLRDVIIPELVKMYKKKKDEVLFKLSYITSIATYMLLRATEFPEVVCIRAVRNLIHNIQRIGVSPEVREYTVYDWAKMMVASVEEVVKKYRSDEYIERILEQMENAFIIFTERQAKDNKERLKGGAILEALLNPQVLGPILTVGLPVVRWGFNKLFGASPPTVAPSPKSLIKNIPDDGNFTNIPNMSSNATSSVRPVYGPVFESPPSFINATNATNVTSSEMPIFERPPSFINTTNATNATNAASTETPIPDLPPFSIAPDVTTNPYWRDFPARPVQPPPPPTGEQGQSMYSEGNTDTKVNGAADGVSFENLSGLNWNEEEFKKKYGEPSDFEKEGEQMYRDILDEKQPNEFPRKVLQQEIDNAGIKGVNVDDMNSMNVFIDKQFTRNMETEHPWLSLMVTMSPVMAEIGVPLIEAAGGLVYKGTKSLLSQSMQNRLSRIEDAFTPEIRDVLHKAFLGLATVAPAVGYDYYKRQIDDAKYQDYLQKETVKRVRDKVLHNIQNDKRDIAIERLGKEAKEAWTGPYAEDIKHQYEEFKRKKQKEMRDYNENVAKENVGSYNRGVDEKYAKEKKAFDERVGRSVVDAEDMESEAKLNHELYEEADETRFRPGFFGDPRKKKTVYAPNRDHPYWNYFNNPDLTSEAQMEFVNYAENMKKARAANIKARKESVTDIPISEAKKDVRSMKPDENEEIMYNHKLKPRLSQYLSRVPDEVDPYVSKGAPKTREEFLGTPKYQTLEKMNYLWQYGHLKPYQKPEPAKITPDVLRKFVPTMRSTIPNQLVNSSTSETHAISAAPFASSSVNAYTSPFGVTNPNIRRQLLSLTPNVGRTWRMNNYGYRNIPRSMPLNIPSQRKGVVNGRRYKRMRFRNRYI